MTQRRLQQIGLGCAALVLVACHPQDPPPPPPLTIAVPPCPPAPAPVNAQAVDQMRAAILQAAAPNPGERVGDIGAGGGWFTMRVARLVGKSGAVLATDINAATIDSLRQAPLPGDDAAPMQFKLIHGERETGLDDLPDNHLDLLLMIDSLCFDQRVARAQNLAYLQQFLRVLKPGGRLLHHMDCTCATSVAETTRLFAHAGFQTPAQPPQLACNALSTAACPTAEAQDRARFLGVFAKPK